MINSGRSAVLMAAALYLACFSAPTQAGNWYDNVKIKGDLRYRHEMIKEEDSNARNRHRIRARVGINAKANEMFDIGIQLATGSSDPVSTNQSLDGAFSTKDMRLDLAYFDFHHEKAPALKITAGKFKNPFYKPGSSELIWDSDWNPEGGVVKIHKTAEMYEINLIGAGLWIEERSSSDDSYLAAGQGMAKFNFNEKKSSVAFGVGFFNYASTRGFELFFDPKDSKGNSHVDKDDGGETINVYANDYELLELSVEATHNFESTRVTIMSDYVTNTAADSLDTGWLVGLRIGKAKKAGSWAFRYIYREVKKDAVLGIFTDSDFRDGGTDANGHEIGGTCQLATNTAFNITYFINEIGLEETKTKDFKKLQVDLQLKF
ncbi:MAG: putative porin [candidate division Zixibacteria bacterium]